MRLNRGTLILIGVSLIVIAAVLLLLGRQEPEQEDIAGDTEAEATPVAIFPGVDAASVVRFEVRDNTTGERTVVTKDDTGGEWAMPDFDARAADAAAVAALGGASDTSIESTSYELNQGLTDETLSGFLALEGVESFEDDNLEQFGLDQPQYTVYAVDEDGAVFALHIGSTNPGGTRYYTVMRQLASGDAETEQFMRPDLERLDVETSLSTELPVPEPDTTEEGTAEAGATAEATGEAESDAEVPTLGAELAEMQETIQAIQDPTEQAELVATYEAMIVATNDAAGEEMDAEATADAADADAAGVDAEGTAEASAVAESVDRLDVETSLDEATEAAAEATGDAATEAAPIDGSAVEVTVEPVAEPLVTLEGTQTILLIPADRIRPLIDLITTPPLALIEATEGPEFPDLSTLPAEFNPEERPENEGATDEVDASEDEEVETTADPGGETGETGALETPTAEATEAG